MLIRSHGVWVKKIVCERNRGREGIPACPQYSPKPKRSSLFPTQMFFWLFWCSALIDANKPYLCIGWWLLALYYHTFPLLSPVPLFSLSALLCQDNPTSISMCFLFFFFFTLSLFLSLFLSACPSFVLRWWAHHQELPSHSSRRSAKRPPRGRTHRRPVPRSHVHNSPTGHSHSCNQPPAGSADPQCLRWSLPDDLGHPWTVDISVCERSWKSPKQLCLFAF